MQTEIKEDAINRKGRSSAWARIEADKQNRIRRLQSPQLFQFRTDTPVNLVPKGTALVLCAREGSEWLARVLKTLEKGDSQALDQLTSDMAIYFGNSACSVASTAVEGAEFFIKEPVYATLSYESRTIVPIMAAPEHNPLFGILIAYNGGELCPESYTFEEFLSSDSETDLDVIIIAREPSLSPLERALMDKIVASEQGLVLGQGGYGIFPGAIAAVIVATLLGTACLIGNNDMSAIRLDDDEINKLGPSASALKLLRLREEVLLRHL